MNEDGTVDWKKMWDNPEEMDWAIGCEHKLLRKHINLITSGKAEARILVPFCGKDPEIPWLLSEGHTVIGIEFVEVAVKGLFKDVALEYNIEECPAVKGLKYTSKNGKLVVFQADLFDCTKEAIGLCDGAWDRGAFEAVITREEKRKYAEVVMSLLTPAAKYLISYFDFHGEGEGHGDHSSEQDGEGGHSHSHDHGHGHEHSEHDHHGEGVPGHDIDLSVVEECFGRFGKCEEIDQWDATEYVSGKYIITDIFYLVSPST